MAVLYIRNSSGEFEGVQSLNGKTAYQAAKEGGYTGTESEFNAKLAQEIPTALPNPQPITINGQRYDGSDAVTVTTVEIDDTLTQIGKAADAKAVGDQLSALNEANATQDEFLNQLKDDLYEQLSPFGKSVQDVMVQGTSTNAKVDIPCKLTEGQTIYVSFDSYNGSATRPKLALYVYDSVGNFTQIGEIQNGFNTSIKGMIPSGNYVGVRVFVGSLVQGETANVGYTIRLVGRIDKIEEALEKLNSRKNYITVSRDGSGDYITISEALASVDDSNAEWVTIFIKNGIYDEVIKNNTKQFIHYLGESRDGVIWLNKTGMYNKAPLLTDGDQIIENITFKMLDDDAPSTWTPGTSKTDESTMLPGYALHIDNGRPSSAVLSTLIAKNCKMYSVAFPAVGMGLHRNQTVIFEDCEFIREIAKNEYLNNNYQGAFLCHDTTTNLVTNQNLIIKNCICRCSKTSSMHLKFEYTNPAEVTATFINNTLWCNETEQATLTAKWHNDTNPDLVAKIHGMSHGNNNAELNA